MATFWDETPRTTLPDASYGCSASVLTSPDFESFAFEDEHFYADIGRMTMRSSHDVDFAPYTLSDFPFELFDEEPDDADTAWEKCSKRFIICPHEIQGVHEVHEILSATNLAEVYRCSFEDAKGELVEAAVKIFDQHVFLDETEAKLLATLHHPNLVRLHAVIDDLPCAVALEYFAGGTLERLLHGQASQDILRSYGTQTRLHGAHGIASALEHLHGAGVMHCEVEPKNCFLTQRAQHGVLPNLKLAGLGCARVDTGCQFGQPFFTGESMLYFRGSIRYMPPEAMQNMTYDVSVDVFSFGILLHELLSGELPYGELKEGQVALRIMEGGHPLIETFSRFMAGTEICSLIGSCLDLPGRRPTSSALVNLIGDMMRRDLVIGNAQSLSGIVSP